MADSKKTIREWCREKGISREALAASCGVSVPTIYSWEKHPGHIRIDYCYKIAEDLGVELREIDFSA